MRARQATFVVSVPSPAKFPPPTRPEIVFVGRSNVGKSSLLNALTGVPKLAKTSSTPGRTQLANWFAVVAPSGAELHFVDLPGFGYAKAPREVRAGWRPMVEALLSRRETVRLVLLLVDARRGPEREEAELVAWLRELHRPVQVVLTKSDKLPKSKRLPAAAAARRALGLRRDPIVFSAETGEGVDALWRAILDAVQSA